MPASYEVRLTPLLKGVPTLLETDAGGITEIANAAATTLVAQFLDDNFEVNIAINDPNTGSVSISMHEPVVADLEPFAQALRIAYSRPGATVPEAIVYGPCNVIRDFGAGIVTLDVQDPLEARGQHHYIRRGDAALNLDDDRGTVAASASSIETIIDCARNTQEQQDRDVPALALEVFFYGDAGSGPLIEFERLQEVNDMVQQILRSVTGPDAYIAPEPAWTYPFDAYAEMGLFDPPTDPAAPAAGELGRNLDPADPDDPQPGEVIFDYGAGLDNLTGLVETPGRPTTHCHVLDADRKHRVTAADAASSAEVGVYVDAFAVDFKVVAGDTAPLQAIADARVNAYGVPPKFFTCTLRPDDAQPYHYGHAFFSADTPGDFQIGDYVRVRAERGYCSFSTLARITAVKFRMENGLPLLDVDMIPAIPGAAGEDPQGS